MQDYRRHVPENWKHLYTCVHRKVLYHKTISDMAKSLPCLLVCTICTLQACRRDACTTFLNTRFYSVFQAYRGACTTFLNTIVYYVFQVCLGACTTWPDTLSIRNAAEKRSTRSWGTGRISHGSVLNGYKWKWGRAAGQKCVFCVSGMGTINILMSLMGMRGMGPPYHMVLCWMGIRWHGPASIITEQRTLLISHERWCLSMRSTCMFKTQLPASFVGPWWGAQVPS